MKWDTNNYSAMQYVINVMRKKISYLNFEEEL